PSPHLLVDRFRETDHSRGLRRCLATTSPCPGKTPHFRGNGKDMSQNPNNAEQGKRREGPRRRSIRPLACRGRRRCSRSGRPNLKKRKNRAKKCHAITPVKAGARRVLA